MANNTLASGQLDGMTPKTQRWFSFDPPANYKGYEPVEHFYKTCTEIAMLELARTNFYGIIHQVYLDRGGFGTAVAMCEEGKRSLLMFRKFDIGTYCLADDDEGNADTLSYEFELTARQAVQWFGYDNLSKTVRDDFDDKTGARKERCTIYIRHVFPRADDDIEIGQARCPQHADRQRDHREEGKERRADQRIRRATLLRFPLRPLAGNGAGLRMVPRGDRIA